MINKTRTIFVDYKIVEKLEKYLEADNGDPELRDIIDRKGRPIFDEEAIFDDGMRGVIQVIPPTDEDSCAWAQAILFNKDGGEVVYTEAQYDLAGTWNLTTGEVRYTIEIVPAKRLNLTCTVTGIYNTSMMVPEEFDLPRAIEYAKEHFNDVPRGAVYDFVNDSDEIDEENCDFEE